MSKRNFILLIIILILVTIGIFVFLYFNNKVTPVGDDGSGTNFTFPPNSGVSDGTNPPVTPPDGGEGEPDTTGEVEQMKLVKVSSMPVAGFGVFSKERMKEIKGTEFIPALRYVDKATGNIYQTFADKIEEKRFSSTIIPKVYDSYFGNKGESVVMRYLKPDERTIETFVGTLPKELLGAEITGNNEVKGYFLPNNVKDISVSPDGQKIFYLFESGDDMIGTTLNLLNNKKTQVFDSSFTEWLSQWSSNNIITLLTKASNRVPGYMYTIDSVGKNFSKVLGEINGLTTLASPNGKLVLYSDGNLSTYIYHTDSRNSDTLSIRTVPEKCVWGKTSDVVYCAAPKSINFGQYPNSWYQGEVSFNDQLWKIDVKTGNATLLIDPATGKGGEEIDGSKLAIDEGENYLFFVNKKDSFLWKLDLK